MLLDEGVNHRQSIGSIAIVNRQSQPNQPQTPLTDSIIHSVNLADSYQLFRGSLYLCIGTPGLGDRAAVPKNQLPVMDEMRAMLDELMGSDRNLPPEERAKIKCGNACAELEASRP